MCTSVCSCELYKVAIDCHCIHELLSLFLLAWSPFRKSFPGVGSSCWITAVQFWTKHASVQLDQTCLDRNMLVSVCACIMFVCVRVYLCKCVCACVMFVCIILSGRIEGADCVPNVM